MQASNQLVVWWERSVPLLLCCMCAAPAVPKMPPLSVLPRAPHPPSLCLPQHFAHAAHLHETVWKQLPAIAEGVGKKVRCGAVRCARCAVPCCRPLRSAPLTSLASLRHNVPSCTGLQAFPRRVSGPALPLPRLRPPPVQGRRGPLRRRAPRPHRCAAFERRQLVCLFAACCCLTPSPSTLTPPLPLPLARPAGPGIFSGRLSDDQRRLLESSPDVPPPGGRFAPPGGIVTPQLVLTGRP